MKDRPKLYYLASSYTHSSKKVMKTRWIKVCKLAAKLLKRGVHNLCPIASSEPTARYGKIKGTEWKDWEALDLNYLDRCDGIIVSKLDKEWWTSVGMRAEVAFAKEHNKPAFITDMTGQLKSISHTKLLRMFDNEGNA